MYSVDEYRSDAIDVGDVILSVNDTATTGLRHCDVVNLLSVHPHSTVTLEMKYAQPEPRVYLCPLIIIFQF